MPLTAKQYKFAVGVAEGLSGTRAAEVAGYSAKTENGLATVSVKNLRKPDIRLQIDKCIEDRQAALHADAMWRRRKLKEIIDYGTTYLEAEDGHTRMLDARAAQGAIDVLNKMDRAYDKPAESQAEQPRLIIDVSPEVVDDSRQPNQESSTILQ